MDNTEYFNNRLQDFEGYFNTLRIFSPSRIFISDQNIFIPNGGMTKNMITKTFKFISYLRCYMRYIKIHKDQQTDQSHYIMTSQELSFFKNIYKDYDIATKLKDNFIELFTCDKDKINASYDVLITLTDILQGLDDYFININDTNLDDAMTGNLTNLVKERILYYIKLHEFDMLFYCPNDILKFLKDNKMKLK